MASLWIRKTKTHKWHYAVNMRWSIGQPDLFVTDCGLQMGTGHPTLPYDPSIERRINRPRQGMCKRCAKLILSLV